MTIYTASVDFARKTPTKNMSGFLHSMNVGTINPSSIAPLKPQYWRIAAGDTTAYNNASKHADNVIVVCSDYYGYPQDNWGGTGVAAYSGSYAAWESAVRTLTAFHSGHDVIWDIWNEPDIAVWNQTIFWDGTQAQYFEAFRRAYHIIRTQLGDDARIIGPSLANYDATAITQFLDYAKKHNFKLEAIAWHELSASDSNIPGVATDISTIKALLESTYPSVATKILIPESVGVANTYSPGASLNWLYNMEQGGADGACRACWNSVLDSTNDCFNATLDGLVGNTSESTPRAAWWAYKNYADIINSRVYTTSSNANLTVMAGTSPSKILVARSGVAPSSADVTLTINNPTVAWGRDGAVTSVIADIYKVEATGESAMPAPDSVRSEIVSLSAGIGTLSLLGILIDELYEIRLSP